MSEFFEGVTALLIFYAIAILASLVLVVQIGLAMFGFDHVDVDVDIDAGDGMGFLSVRALVGFFGGFGWTGVIMLENGASVPAATAAGIGAGFVLMLLIAGIIKIIYSFEDSGTIDLKNAIGEIATVYVTVPAGQSGAGQVRVLVQGRLKVAAAMTRAQDPISSEKKVRVTDVVDATTLLVEPLGDTR